VIYDSENKNQIVSVIYLLIRCPSNTTMLTSSNTLMELH